MKKALGYLKKVLEYFGFKKNSKYVRHYLDESNLRSGVLMALVVVALEIWLIVRQHNKYIIPQVANGADYWDSLFKNTSNFWLLLLVGVVMFAFCFGGLYKNKRPTFRFWITVGAAAVLIGYTFFAFLEPYRAWDKPSNVFKNLFLILLYILSGTFGLTVVGYSLFVKLKKRESDPLGMVCITFFALICLVFGMKVSYSDFASTSETDKMIICFLTMVLYVACLLVWKPYLSIAMLGVIFLGFYYILLSLSDQREFRSGDVVNYITFYISLVMVAVSLYQQRYKDATKAEELEHKANYDDLTELHNYAHFLNQVKEFIAAKRPIANSYIYLFLDVSGFKTINDTYGFAKGNEFLVELGKKISAQFGEEFTARLSDDHFAAFCPAEEAQGKIGFLTEEVRKMDGRLHPHLNFGAYVYQNPEEAPRRAMDKARYACSSIKNRNDQFYCEYDRKMHQNYHMLQYVTTHLEEAVEKGWIRPYYQPVVFSKGRKLCGVEALARWIDPKHGFLNPGQFVPFLEGTRMIHKLDACIFEAVCRDLRERLDQKLPVVPVSINFSRLDFELMDAVEVFDSLVQKYQIPKEYLHVEVTESALNENDRHLIDSTRRLKEKGYALWLDDFGSGYSSLNVLKDFDFDVLKIDMKFLIGFGTNQKAEPLIQSVIDMAGKIGLKTLTEGVETEEQANFLEKGGCLRLQGYRFGKPMPKEEILGKIDAGEFEIQVEE